MNKDNTQKIIYFVRHGQSEANISLSFQMLSSPLTELGKNQAKLIAERIANISFDTLISSPLTRAKQTALTISEVTHKVPEYSDLFVERVKPSSLYGKSHADMEASKISQAWDRSLYTSGERVEDGENFDDLIARADQALEFLKNRPEKTMVVVTHGYFLRTLVARVLLGVSLTEMNFKVFQANVTMENTGLSAIKFAKGSEKDCRWRLWVYNDHAHLG